MRLVMVWVALVSGKYSVCDLDKDMGGTFKMPAEVGGAEFSIYPATMVLGNTKDVKVTAGSCGHDPNKLYVPIYSATKMITAITAMKLVELKKLALDQPVSTYLTWWTKDGSDPRSLITLRHLLSMTSGFGDHACSGSSKASDTQESCAKAIYETRYSKFKDSGTMFQYKGDIDPDTVKPGSHFFYKESDWAITALLISVASGAADIDAAFGQLIRTPLKIEQKVCAYNRYSAMTAFAVSGKVDASLVDGGGGLSCDTASYAKVLGSYYAGEILTTSTTEEMETAQTLKLKSKNLDGTALGATGHYGLGMWRICTSGTDCSNPAFTHSAGLSGWMPFVNR
jgi:CubicO group peptidase (beta-lactamase class C family)